MRTSGLTAVDVQAEFDRGHFLRTHILRPTWHFVAAEDIRWILKVTAPRVQKLNQTIYRQAGLDPATLDRGLALIVEELRDRRYRTRAARPGIGRSTLALGIHRHERRTPGSHLQWPDAR
jgi:Winged helix DNA-binding domain